MPIHIVFGTIFAEKIKSANEVEKQTKNALENPVLLNFSKGQSTKQEEGC